MKIRLNKIIDAEPASKYEAESLLGIKIKNILHGDSGFIINNKWFPRDVILKKSVPYNTDNDIASFIILELDNACSKLSPRKINKNNKSKLINSIHNLLTLLNNDK